MKFSRKNIVFCIVFTLGILLSYNIYFQLNNLSKNIEISSESDLKSNCLTSDSEVHGDDQIINNTEILSVYMLNYQATSLQFSNPLFQPSFTVWQPPKIS